MLSKEEIRQWLHASRVVPLSVEEAHGPLGLEQLAAVVSRVNPSIGLDGVSMRLLVILDYKTWEKLQQLAETVRQTTSQCVTASQVAAAIIEQFVVTMAPQGETQK